MFNVHGMESGFKQSKLPMLEIDGIARQALGQNAEHVGPVNNDTIIISNRKRCWR